MLLLQTQPCPLITRRANERRRASRTIEYSGYRDLQGELTYGPLSTFEAEADAGRRFTFEVVSLRGRPLTPCLARLPDLLTVKTLWSTVRRRSSGAWSCCIR